MENYTAVNTDYTSTADIKSPPTINDLSETSHLKTITNPDVISTNKNKYIDFQLKI